MNKNIINYESINQKILFYLSVKIAFTRFILTLMKIIDKNSSYRMRRDAICSLLAPERMQRKYMSYLEGLAATKSKRIERNK